MLPPSSGLRRRRIDGPCLVDQRHAAAPGGGAFGLELSLRVRPVDGAPGRFRRRAADTRAGAFDAIREAITALLQAVRGSGEEI